MRSSRNQLILLGLICQAFSWDNYVLPLISILLWAACLKLPRQTIRAAPILEATSLVVGIGLAYYGGKMAGKGTHFVIGYGLSLLQLLRLLRPLERRERIGSIAIACLQIGVACTVVMDYRFLLIFIAALFLIPKSLMELELSEFGKPAENIRPRISWAAVTVIVAVTAVFYVAFPRGFLGTGVQAPGLGTGSPGTLMDDVLDPSRGGSSQSERVLMQIQGEKLGYLRCFALLDMADGNWVMDRQPLLRPMPSIDTPPTGLRRRVRVKNIQFLNHGLPVDGWATQVSGKFFRLPFRTEHETVYCQVIWNTVNNVYEYWLDPNHPPRDLRSGEIERCTRYPEQSERLRAWLENLVTSAKPRPAGARPVDPKFAEAQLLELYFRNNFKYRIGAPQLSRSNTADDFIFNQREGHCERFATHLALLLRMRGIPSRVVVGYVPNSRSWLSDWYNVRFNDAHAWTEAWFPGQGWVQFDGTPAGQMDRSAAPWRELMDTVDFVWYAKIVAFDAPTQSQLMADSVAALGSLTRWLGERIAMLIVVVLSVGAAWFGFKYSHLLTRPERRREKAKERQRIFAENCYGRMLKALDRRGFHRAPAQTPLEFVSQLKAEAHPMISEIDRVTQDFCALKSGSRMLAREEERVMEQALSKVERWQPQR